MPLLPWIIWLVSSIDLITISSTSLKFLDEPSVAILQSPTKWALGSQVCLTVSFVDRLVWAEDKWLQENAGKVEEDKSSSAAEYTSKLREKITGEKPESESAPSLKREATAPVEVNPDLRF